MTTTQPETPVLRRAIVSPLDHVEWRESGNGVDYTLRGHAAVFNRLSEDLGGFRELIEPGFFRSVLRKNPDVRALFNHDPKFVLGRTASTTLELREDTTGLHVWCRMAPLTWVSDLRASMQRGDIDQMSFRFTVLPDGDAWAVTDDGVVVRTLKADGCGELVDVSVVTFPAYPQTDAAMRSVLDDAVKRGRLAQPPGAESKTQVAPDDPAGGDAARKRRIHALRAEGAAALIADLKE